MSRERENKRIDRKRKRVREIRGIKGERGRLDE